MRHRITLDYRVPFRRAMAGTLGRVMVRTNGAQRAGRNVSVYEHWLRLAECESFLTLRSSKS